MDKIKWAVSHLWLHRSGGGVRYDIGESTIVAVGRNARGTARQSQLGSGRGYSSDSVQEWQATRGVYVTDSGIYN